MTREAPTLWVGTRYTLFSVAVAKGSLAYAVGGAVSTPFGAGSAGAIVYTTNGGISWAQAVYPGAADPNVPCLMAVAVQPAGGHANKPVWAGGYATLTDFAFSALGGGLVGAPAAADFCAPPPHASAPSPRPCRHTPLAPVLTGPPSLSPPCRLRPDPVVATIGFITSGAATVASGNRTKGQVYTLLLSMDGGKTFNPAPAATLPDGFVQTSFAHTAASALLQPRHIYGITWDNAKHGWIYGNGFIIVRAPGFPRLCPGPAPREASSSAPCAVPAHPPRSPPPPPPAAGHAKRGRVVGLGDAAGRRERGERHQGARSAAAALAPRAASPRERSHVAPPPASGQLTSACPRPPLRCAQVTAVANIPTGGDSD